MLVIRVLSPTKVKRKSFTLLVSGPVQVLRQWRTQHPGARPGLDVLAVRLERRAPRREEAELRDEEGAEMQRGQPQVQQ